jgi:hypothetical protein
VVIRMAALTAGANRADATADRGLRGPSLTRTAGPAAADRSPAIARRAKTVRSWPLLVLAAPAAAEVWSGWVGIAEKTGFGRVSPLPGIWPSLHLDTTITLPVGVEAYAAYALRAWLASEHTVSPRTRQFAKWSAICSFLLGMAGQVASHLLADAGAARAPWAITTVVSCLPVLVLGMGTALAHMLRADAAADRSGTTDDAPDRGIDGPASPPSARWSPADQAASDQAPVLHGDRTARSPRRDGGDVADRVTAPAARTARNTYPKPDETPLIVRRLAAAGTPMSRRTLRSNGVAGSNARLGALARTVNAELAAAAAGKRAGPSG